MSEHWLPLPDYEGLYEVSDFGRVRSLNRTVHHTNGSDRHLKGRLLRQFPSKHGGYPSVSLCKDGKPRGGQRVHVLVLSAFVGPRPDGMESRHLNGDCTDSRLANLAYGTALENADDKRRHGTHNNTRKTQCKNKHPYTAENTYYFTQARTGRVMRKCKTCHRAAEQASAPRILEHRRAQIVALTREGYSAREIAAKLGVTRGTVHKNRVQLGCTVRRSAQVAA